MATQSNRSRKLNSQLTMTEVTVIKAIARFGDRNAAARGLCMSPHTLKSHLGHVYSRLGVHSVEEMIVTAIAVGIIKLEDAGSRMTPERIKELQKANMPWLSLDTLADDDVSTLDTTVASGVHAPPTDPNKRGIIELNGVCLVKLTNVGMDVTRDHRTGIANVKLRGNVASARGKLEDHLGQPWLTKAQLNGIGCRTGHRIVAKAGIAEVRNGITRVRLDLSWVEKRQLTP